MPVIGLLSDFGTRDYYVAAMKGVILQLNPKAVIVDVSHEVAAQNLFEAAFLLRQTLPCFAPGTIFAAVVDPGVGSGRRILAGRYSDRIVLAPDNGLLTLLHRDAELQDMRVVENRRYFASQLSSTFHGRDIFAPVAAHLSRGVSLDQLGPPADRIEILELPRPTLSPDGTITGEVIVVDRFGNLITNISQLDLSSAHSQRRNLHAYLADRDVGPLRTTYADVAPGEPLALVGSSQMLEVAVRNGNAALELNASPGVAISLR